MNIVVFYTYLRNLNVKTVTRFKLSQLSEAGNKYPSIIFAVLHCPYFPFNVPHFPPRFLCFLYSAKTAVKNYEKQLNLPKKLSRQWSRDSFLVSI